MSEQLDIHVLKRKKNLDLNFTSYAKIKSKWIRGINITHKTAKVLEKNIAEKSS